MKADTFSIFLYLSVGSIIVLRILNINCTMTNRLKALLIGSGGLLVVPFIASQFSDEVNWSGFDYLVMAILFGTTSVALDFILTKAKNKQSRWAWGIAVVLALVIVWVEIAVGVFGSLLAGN